MPGTKPVNKKNHAPKKSLRASKQPRPIPPPPAIPQGLQNADYDPPMRIELVLRGEIKNLFLTMVRHDSKTPAEWLADDLKQAIDCFLESKEHDWWILASPVSVHSPTSVTVG